MRGLYTAIVLLLFFLPSTNLYPQICINEYLSRNINGIMDEDHEYCDWIEIFNKGNTPADLTGFGLSDQSSGAPKWIFPDAWLPAGKHLLIFASGKDRKIIPLKFETVIDVGEDWNYLVPSSDLGSAWHGTGFDDSSWQTGSSSFGYGDNDDSTVIENTALSLFIRKEFLVTNMQDIARLILTVDYDDGFVAYINGHEVARANFGTKDEYMAWNRLATAGHEAAMYYGGKPEYFEISDPSVLNDGINVIAIQVHNNAPGSTDLSVVPFLTAGRLTGENLVSPWLEFPVNGALHTNFRMDADSESVYLFDPQGTIVDSTPHIQMIADISCGRYSDGNPLWSFFGMPSPGSGNSGGTANVKADSVMFSPEGGIHPGGVTVKLSSPGGANDSIFYTLDGSIPDLSSELYTTPVNLDSTSVIRARVIKHGLLPGSTASRTYITELDHDVPVVCLTTEPYNLWDNLAGIYTFGPNTPTQVPYYEANFWKDWERPVHMEVYDTEGIRQIDQDAGMKIFGGWSRANPQKSISLFARSDYGKGSFKYRFFKTKPIDKFESLVLRNSGNDNMGLQFHDCFMTGLASDMDVDVQAYQPAAVYLNGEYWGLLNIREKVSENYVAENFSVDADSVNLLEYNGQVIEGTNSGYTELFNFMNLKTSLQNEADFDWVQNRIDMDNFIQYQILNIYLNNRDWPGNNIKYWSTTAPGSKWRWIAFDTDFGFGIWNVEDYGLNTLYFALDPFGPNWPNPPWSTLFLRRLISNSGFRNNFVNQFCDRLNQDFLPARINHDLDSLKTLYNDEIIKTFNRWDSSYDDWVCNYGGWLTRINDRKTFGLNRPANCRQHLQSEFQLSTWQNVTINVSGSEEGYVKLNSIYVKSYPFTGIYSRNIPIKMTAIPKPGYKFTGWTGSVNSTQAEISFNMAASGTFMANFSEASASDFSVIINEINYNSAVTLNTKDWVEIHNNGHTTVDLSGWLLTDSNVDSGYVFPSGTFMIPGSFLIVCRDREDFRAYHPNVKDLIGEIQFGLSSEGDIVRLFDNDNNLIDAVNYGPILPWPDANGTGKSLELKNPSLNNSLPENWHAMVTGGTPGAANTGDTTTTGGSGLETTIDFECFPNPFTDFTTISFEVQTPGIYRLEVYDMQGRLFKILHDSYLDPGSYWIDWNADGSENRGVYSVRLVNNSKVHTLKVVRLE